MPFNTFAPNSKIKSSEVNTNFQNTVHVSDLQKISNKINIPPVVTDNSGAFDCDTGSWFKRTLTAGNKTLSLTNDDVDQVIIIEITSDGSNTLTWFGGIKWEDGSAPDGDGASNGDILVYAIKVVTAGSAYLGFIVAENMS